MAAILCLLSVAVEASSCAPRRVRVARRTWLVLFDFRCHLLWPRYWPGGVPVSTARARTPGALYVTTGPYHWRGEPIERVRIGSLVIPPQTLHPDWPYLAWRRGRLRANRGPDPRAAWELRGGPLLVGRHTVGRIYDRRVLRAQTQRRAVLWVEGGSGFAVLEGIQTLAGVRAIMHRMGYTHAFLLDGGSSTAPKARNPVYLFVFPRR
ncbi:MAG: hypothetical protein QN172_05185 [Armatimonadota bacterium]|nr:hypothetical protein [Armatimonadota bacterium]MDR7438707.1 hypothetical protein [Armatimonadota bacterium]MDR7568707.1 hypothetical protein [Armatimonadota bacterium]MDR7601834.1 hypothetical protein [Armatimonadota bacterium]